MKTPNEGLYFFPKHRYLGPQSTMEGAEMNRFLEHTKTQLLDIRARQEDYAKNDKSFLARQLAQRILDQVNAEIARREADVAKYAQKI